tara:strand:+ start:238 stop:486 length:249 start_codon:yes stop_codon:yes gene_type:complete
MAVVRLIVLAVRLVTLMPTSSLWVYSASLSRVTSLLPRSTTILSSFSCAAKQGFFATNALLDDEPRVDDHIAVASGQDEPFD